METYELRYFLGIAKNENIHRAAEELRVSPASLSKAVARLEAELGVALFSREGRNIRITDQGRLLQRRASQMIHLEEAAKSEISGHKGTLNIVLSGPEVLLSRYTPGLIQSIRKRNPNSRFELRSVADEAAVRHVEIGESHLAIVTASPERGLRSKILGQAKFAVGVGKGHPLFRKAQAGTVVPIEDVLKHPFVSPSHPILGEVEARQSLDGWRDDQFRRTIDFRTTSLTLIEELVCGGNALAYLPDYFVETIGASTLKISGCPYSCKQKIRLIARSQPELGWINQIL